jgi:hypothetical protein
LILAFALAADFAAGAAAGGALNKKDASACWCFHPAFMVSPSVITPASPAPASFLIRDVANRIINHV